jgi:hypothetical protein
MAMRPNQVIHLLRETARKAMHPDAKALWNDAADTVEGLAGGWEKTPLVPVQIDWSWVNQNEDEPES